MPFNFRASTITLGAITAMALALPTHAQTPPLKPSPLMESFSTGMAPESATQPGRTPTNLQIYTSAHRLTGGQQNWKEIGVRGSHTTGAHVVYGEAASMRRFGESGVFVGLGDTYTFNPDWFGSVAVGAGDGASYLPTVRVDGFINRKLLVDRNLIASLGLGYYRAPDRHSDRNISLGATYYFSEPLILQGEVRFNNSRPGSVTTRQQFLALTWGRNGATQLTARHAWGREGYQTIGNGDVLVDFSSHQSSLNLRHWLGADWGIAAGVERYHNPYYNRTGATLALFSERP